MKDGVDAEDLERIKQQIRASEIYAQDDVGNIARRYGAALTSGLTVADVQAWPRILEAVTEAEIMAAAARIFNRDTAVTGWAMPEGAEEVMQ